MAATQEFYQSIAALIQQGEPTGAINQLNSFLANNPNDSTALSMLGSAHLRAGDTDKAINCFKSGIRKNPNSFAAHADLAFASMQTGDTAQAISAFEQATVLNAQFYQAWCFLEKLYFDSACYDAAISASSAAEECDPFDSDYQNIQAAMRADKKGQAESIARDILQQQQGHPRAVYLLAHLAGTVGAHEETVKILKHGLDAHPANISLRRALIQALEELGAYIPAIVEAELLTVIQPDYQNWLILSRVHGHIAHYEDALIAAEKSAACLDTENTELGKIDLLRGHALKILGRREESEKAYHACLVNTPGNGAGWWGLADLKSYQFTDTEFAAMQALVESDEDIAQRCQAAFALGKAHENKGNATEAFHWYKKANALRPNINFNQTENNRFADDLVANFDRNMLQTQASATPTGPIPIFILGLPRSGSTLIEQILASHSQVEGTQELTTLPKLERRISIQGGKKFSKKYPSSLPEFPDDDLLKFGQNYIDETSVYRTDKPYFIDKLPPNYERVGLIHKIMPHAIIIDARRHPVDCGYSAYKQHFAAGHEYSYDLSDIGNYYNGYLKIMDHWDAVLPGKVICVQYENMVRDTEETIRNLLDRMGLEFEESCLRFFENKRAVGTASSEQVRQPIYTKGMGQWHAVEDELSPLIESLGKETMARFRAFGGRP